MQDKKKTICYVNRKYRTRKHGQKVWDSGKRKQQTMWKERRGLQILPKTVLSAVVSARCGRDGVRLHDELFALPSTTCKPHRTMFVICRSIVSNKRDAVSS